MNDLTAYRQQRAMDLATLAIDTAKAMVAPVPAPTGGPCGASRLRTPGELFSVYLMDEMTREPMPVVELPEVE